MCKKEITCQFRITPVLLMVLVLLFVLNGCGRGMELQELTQQSESGQDEDRKKTEEAAGALADGGERVRRERYSFSRCLVHICGAVKEPGVYSLPEGSRVVMPYGRREIDAGCIGKRCESGVCCCR